LAAGHRLRIDIASSAAPQYLPNPGTDVAIGADGPGEGVVAHQQVFHDAAHRSVVVLPVIP
jgi:predicted acyl esterase